MGRVVHLIKKSLKASIRKLLYLSPINKRKVVFLNYDGKGYGDNSKYIAEEIRRRNLQWNLVWLVSGEDYVPAQIKTVNISGFKALYELSTAKVIINNCKFNFPTHFRKKNSQFYLQTWHGDFALKYIEKEIESELSLAYLSKSKADSAMTDAIVSGSRLFTSIVKDSFWLPKRCSILEFGVPRNDLYFKGSNYRDSLKQRYGFSLKDRILLYAPTFRDKGETDCYDLDFNRLRDSLCVKDESDWKIIVRLHPNISKQDILFTYNESIINGSVFPDQQELCMISDCLVTDYSSIMGDFLLMGKPVFLYVPDLDRYSSRTEGRGLRDLFYNLPLPFCRTQSELEKVMIAFDGNAYANDVNAFLKTYYHPFDDGHASERIVDFLIQIMR